MIDEQKLLPYGLGFPNLIEFQKGYFVDKEIISDLNKLNLKLKKKGFKLKIESAYRSFYKQLSIWNKKAKGDIPLLDAFGNKMEIPKDEEKLMYAILTWSALPGASRHHLGTDIDVIDELSCPLGYEVQLTTEECSSMFFSFHEFLTELFSEEKSFGFNRVFIFERGCIQPEPWHIAHLPTSRKRLELFSLKTLKEIYEHTEIACKEALLDNFDSLAKSYIFPYFI